MELFSILAVILSSVIGAVSTIATNKENKDNANEQLQNQQEFSHNEAELANQRALENYWATQSPQSRVQQMKDAGLSVGLMYGGAGNGGFNVTSQATTPSATLPVMQNPMQGGLSDLFQNLKALSESENLGADTEKKKEETNKLKSDIEVNNATITQIATENNLTEVLTNNAKLDGILKEIENEVAEGTKQNRIAASSQQLENLKNEGQKMLKEIESLNIDNENKQKMYNATINKLAAETSLIWKNVIKADIETQLLKATTALTTEQTNMTYAQKQKALKEIEKTKSEMAKIDAEIKLMETQGEKIKWDKTTDIISAINGAAKAATMYIK